jgi:hypothetical protein
MEANNASVRSSLVFMVQDFKTQVIVDIILVILKLLSTNPHRIRPLVIV